MITNLFGNLPTPVKGGIVFSTVGLVMLGAIFFGGSKKAILIVLVGIIAVGVLLVLLYFLFRWISKKKGKSGSEKIKNLFSKSPRVSADKQAKLDQLRDQFLSGIETFKKAGMDLYSFPWYVIIGESGSGKSEALRHCNIGFPPGLQDPFQGTGGTINMDWWFTNDAVIVDTAGRMMFEEVNVESEWIALLKYLNKFRTHQPINGVFLVISAESLIKDSADEIKSKASQISQRLHEIQNTLDLRFPVYILITKADLICGFREFFEDAKEPKIQNQLFGWSNAAPLDEPFNPEEVGKNLEPIIKRVKEWRFGLLKSENDEDSRIKIASLYAFPQQLEDVIPRLQLYLEQIFPSGRQIAKTWSKPLFVRGIYFTSSMQEGLVLDKAVAELLGQDIGSINSELNVGKKEISFFLHDLFKKKAFREDGLVTRATNVKKQKRMRQLVLASVGILSVLLLLFQTWYSSKVLETSIGTSKDLWVQVAMDSNLRNIGGKSHWRPIVNSRLKDGQKFYDDQDPITIQGKQYRTIELLNKLYQQAESPVKIPKVFRLAQFNTDFRADMEKAIESLYRSSIISTLEDATRVQLKNMQQGKAWESKHTKALKSLIRLETYALHPKIEVTKEFEGIDHFFNMLLDEEQLKEYTKDKNLNKTIFNRIYSEKVWPPPGLVPAEPRTLKTLDEISNGLTRFIQSSLELESVKLVKSELKKIDQLDDSIQEVIGENKNPDIIVNKITSRLDAILEVERKSILTPFSDVFKTVSKVADFEKLNWTTAYNDLKRQLEEFNNEMHSLMEKFDEISDLSQSISKQLQTVGGSVETTTLMESFTNAADQCLKEINSRLSLLSLPNPSENLLDENKKKMRKLIREIKELWDTSLSQFKEREFDLQKYNALLKKNEENLSSLLSNFHQIKSNLGRLNDRFTIYELANNQLSLVDEIPLLCDLVQFLGDLQSENEKIQSTIKTNPEDEISPKAERIGKDLCNLSLRLRARNVLANKFEKFAQNSLGQIQETIIELGKQKTAEKLKSPSKIPHTIFDPKFHTFAASKGYKCWKDILDFLQQDQQMVLDRGTLVDSHKSLQVGWNQYIDHYTNYWLNSAPKKFEEQAEKLVLDQKYPAIPFSMKKEQTFSPLNNPGMTVVAINAISKLTEEINDKEVLDQIHNQFFMAIKNYFIYWSEIALEGLNLQEISWPELHEKISNLKVWEVHDTINELCNIIEEAINVVQIKTEEKFPGALGKRGISANKLVLEKIEKTRKMIGPSFSDACQKMISTWASLPTQSQEARLKILNTNPSEISQQYLGMFTQNPGTFVDTYWSNLGILLLKSLANASQVEADIALSQLKEKCFFPLGLPESSGKELSSEKVKEVFDLINRILAPIPAKKQQDSQKGFSTGDEIIDNELKRLTGETLSSEQVETLLATQKIASALLAKKYTIHLVKIEEQDKDHNGISVWRSMGLGDGERFRTQQSDDKLLGNFDLPGDPFSFRFFKHTADPEPDRTVTINSKWLGIRILHEATVKEQEKWFKWRTVSRSEGGKVWTIAIVVKDDLANERSTLFRLTFESGLPEIKDWPSWN